MNRSFQWVLVGEDKYGNKLLEMFPHSISPRPYTAKQAYGAECSIQVWSKYSQDKYAEKRCKELAFIKNFTLRLVDSDMNLIETWSLDGAYVHNSKVAKQDGNWSLFFTISYADGYHQMNMDVVEALYKMSKSFGC